MAFPVVTPKAAARPIRMPCLKPSVTKLSAWSDSARLITKTPPVLAVAWTPMARLAESAPLRPPAVSKSWPATRRITPPLIEAISNRLVATAVVFVVAPAMKSLSPTL
ncbi:unannotated protein [freshwater metagenome]|uniref:Unannotated protein n=1 Tax=freshwater metagenome TaxID=449393 RepID=A0A6J7JVC5_9ZZZZ